MYNVPELLAATPPIDSLKYVLRRAAMNREQQLMCIDVARAHLCADAARGVYVQQPPEDQTDDDKNSRGKLVKTMYGMRGAAQWQRTCTETNKKLGLVSPCRFYHEKRYLSGLVHSDTTSPGARAG